LAALADHLYEQAQQREQAEIARVQQVLALAEQDGCQTAALAAHFGELLAQDCGHCGWCKHGSIQLAPRNSPALADALLPQIRQFLATGDSLFSKPLALARFLCGITSPQLSRLRLGAHPLAGCLAEVPFAQVLQWIRQISGEPQSK
jgi:ATP-dependent DNA helicase RecQ